MKIFILFLILLNLSFFMTSEEYWQKLNIRADEIYSGLDLALTVNVGNYYDNSESNFRSGVRFSIPIYSKQQKISRRNAKIKYLQDRLGLISSIKKNRTINLVFLKERHIDIEAYERALEQVININSSLAADVASDLVRGILRTLERF